MWNTRKSFLCFSFLFFLDVFHVGLNGQIEFIIQLAEGDSENFSL